VHTLRSDKVLSSLYFCGLLAGFGFAVCLPASAAEQIAQAIPAVTPVSGIYAHAPVASGGALGQAIDEATAASAEPATTSGAAGAGPISLPRIDATQSDEESRKIAQAASGAPGTTVDNKAPVDLAPVKLLERTSPVFPANQFQTGLLYKLPAKFFFYSSTENSLRYETNVLQTLHHNRSDMVYRVLPNITAGYALTPRTRVSANYFFLRDQYTRDNHALSRNIHSIGGQIQHDIPITERTNLTAGFMGRQLLLSRGQPLSDLLPSLQLTHRVGARGILYGGVLGQIRFRNTLGKFQEGDQFYSFGGMYRLPRWFFLWDNTFITNFGNRRLRFGPNNQNMIMTLEADYRISPRIPVVAFVRAQPIFNIGADEATGFAGFNFRIFGGLRLDLNKSPVFPVKMDKRGK
jgi:hypothetical protein